MDIQAFELSDKKKKAIYAAIQFGKGIPHEIILSQTKLLYPKYFKIGK